MIQRFSFISKELVSYFLYFHPMKNRWLFLLSILFSVFNAVAQGPWPPVYELKADTSVNSIPDTYWQMLEDKSGNLTLNDITQSAYSIKFHQNNSSKTGLGYSGVRHYWVRIRIKNLSGKDQRLVMGNDIVNIKTETYVFRSNGRAEYAISGWGVGLKARTYFPTATGILVKIAKDEDIILYEHYVLSDGEVFNKLDFGFQTYDKFIEDRYISEPVYKGDTRSAFIAGLLIFGFFLNIFFYTIVKEKVYLWYSLFLLLEGVWYLSAGTWFLAQYIPSLVKHFDLIFTYSLFFFSVSQFVRQFLKTAKYYPRWNKVLLVLITLTILNAFLRLYVDTVTPFWLRGIPAGIQNSIFFLNNFALLVTFFFRKKEEDKFSVLAIIAAVPAFVMWSFVYGVGNLFNFLSLRYDIQRPPFLTWLEKNSNTIEMYCVGWFVLLFTWILLQRYSSLRRQLTQQALEREREKAELMMQQNELLEKKVEERTAELKQSIEHLTSTQQQLIQSEKMASLGELTAGIAHEIQNPLNFVNNFSEVNKELIGELREEMKSGNIEEIDKIFRSIEDNEEKVMFHGKRADAIVKSMLQHSRTSTGKKELTDINALADEYLRLSYHGLRAKDKNFNANFKVDFDQNVGNIEIASQEVGRVLLNLINNAFYAVSEKKKLVSDPTYNPEVTVSTRKEEEKVIITVKDNGKGIPKNVVDKIFQPFFTTKPAGEGTGLGLSLAYDIIVNGHGGDLQVKTNEGEGTEFVIIFPSQPKI